MLESFRRACLLAWLVVSAAIAPVLAAPFLLPEHTVVALAAAFRTKAHAEGRCPLCGMTHAFLALSRGDFQSAARSNSAAAPLFGALLVNEVAAGFTFLRRPRRRKRIIMGDKAGD